MKRRVCIADYSLSAVANGATVPIPEGAECVMVHEEMTGWHGTYQIQFSADGAVWTSEIQVATGAPLTEARRHSMGDGSVSGTPTTSGVRVSPFVRAIATVFTAGTVRFRVYAWLA